MLKVPNVPDRRLAWQWFGESSRLLAQTESMLDLLHEKILAISGRYSNDPLLQIQELALGLSVAVGRERALLGAAIAI